MNHFNIHNYSVIKKAISLEMSNFIYDYICLRRRIANYLFQNKLISPYNKYFGHWTDPQVLNAYSIYGDTVMETLLLKLKPLMKKETENELIEMYSYCRIYKKNDILHRHKDRTSCEISTTLFLGGDNWPIFLEPSGERNLKGVRVDLEPGDMLVYKGCLLEHWREPFEGENCAQVFLHYNIKNEESEKKKYDKREFIGVPNR